MMIEYFEKSIALFYKEHTPKKENLKLSFGIHFSATDLSGFLDSE